MLLVYYLFTGFVWAIANLVIYNAIETEICEDLIDIENQNKILWIVYSILLWPIQLAVSIWTCIMHEYLKRH